MNTQPSQSHKSHLPVPSVGQRYQLRREVDREPYFLAQPGLVGTLIHYDEHLIRLQMLEELPGEPHFVGAEEFDNCIEWYDYEPTEPLLEVFYEDCQLLDQYLLITVRMVPPGALCDDEQDFLHRMSAFRLETQTPQASVFKQDNAAGLLTLLLPSQQQLTPSQCSWLDTHAEIIDHECFF
jgi:hypothetical protein